MAEDACPKLLRLNCPETSKPRSPDENNALEGCSDVSGTSASCLIVEPDVDSAVVSLAGAATCDHVEPSKCQIKAEEASVADTPLTNTLSSEAALIESAGPGSVPESVEFQADFS